FRLMRVALRCWPRHRVIAKERQRLWRPRLEAGSSRVASTRRVSAAKMIMVERGKSERRDDLAKTATWPERRPGRNGGVAGTATIVARKKTARRFRAEQISDTEVPRRAHTFQSNPPP